jgi:glutamate-ammonia-ligase adenylyltransferase
MRDEAERNLEKNHGDGVDVKDGPGGIRDVEFFVQAFQMIHAPRIPEILDGNTLRSLGMLEEMGILSPGLVADLREDYLFLRRVEHALQLAEDRQTHRLPEDAYAGAVLARRMAWFDRGAFGSFGEELRQRMARVRETVNPLFRGPGSMGEYKNVGLQASPATKT